MADTHLLLLVVALSGQQWTAAAAGLQIYFYQYPPAQIWRIEGLATWINTSSFSQNLDCNTSSSNGAHVGWTRQAGLNPNWVQSVTNGKRLTLDSFTNPSYLGIYTCYDSETNESLNVNITSANPAIQAVSDVVTIEAGSSGQLKVYVSGVPDPVSTDITWFKVGPGEINTELKEPTVNFSSDHHTLLLSDVQESDRGTYKCIVTQNSYPSANVTMQLDVIRKNAYIPVIHQPPNNVSLQASSNLTLTCIVGGSPNITITWMRTDMKLLSPLAQVVTSYNGMTTESILLVLFIQRSDGGQYQCVATSAGLVVYATAYVMVQAGPDFNATTVTPSGAPGEMKTEAPTTHVIIPFVSVIIGTTLIATCLSVTIMVVWRLKFCRNKHNNLLLQGIRLQNITHPQVEDIDLHDDVFSTGIAIGNTFPKGNGSRRQRPSGSTSSSTSLLDGHDIRLPSTEGSTRLPAIVEDALPDPPSSGGGKSSLPMEEHTSAGVPHYTLISPRDPNPVSSHHHTTGLNPLAANSGQYADLLPVPYLTPSTLNMMASASQSSQLEVDSGGPTIGTSPRPWYENSNSSLRLVGIHDDIQPYATTSNLSIPLDPLAERTWDLPPRPPSVLPCTPVPLPYTDPAPLRQTLGRSSKQRSQSPIMNNGDLV